MTVIADEQMRLVRPLASELLTRHLEQRCCPHWTSFFVKWTSVREDMWGRSHFNWPVRDSNYHVLRTGCFPYVKFHCTRREPADLTIEDMFFRLIKVANLGIPCLAYGLAATLLIKHMETVQTSKGPVKIYFLEKEDAASRF